MDPRQTLHPVGQDGAVNIDDTFSHPGDFFAITFVTDTVFHADTTISNWYGTSYTGKTWPAGIIIWGKIEEIRLVSGWCVGYLGVEESIT